MLPVVPAKMCRSLTVLLITLCTTISVSSVSVVETCVKDPDVNTLLCSNVTVKCCLQALDEFDAEVNAAVVPFLEEHEYREHCRLYQDFEDCMQPSKQNCSKADQLLFEGIEASYQYWCVDTVDEYLEHQSCLSDPELHDEGEICSTQFDEAVTAIDRSQGSHHIASKHCHYSENYLDCVYNAVKHTCGSEAANWQVGFDARALKPVLDEMGCLIIIDKQDNRDDDGDDNKMLMVGLLGALAALILIIIVAVIFVLLNKSRKPRRPRDPHTMPNGFDPPPPYITYDPVTGAQMIVPTGGEAQPLPDKHQPPPSYVSNGHRPMTANSVHHTSDPSVTDSRAPPPSDYSYNGQDRYGNTQRY